MNKVNDNDNKSSTELGYKFHAAVLALDKPSYLIPYIPGFDDRKSPGFSALTKDEQKCLDEYEKEIATFLKAFYLVAERLDQIKQKNLFRQTHPNFASYCFDKLCLMPLSGMSHPGPLREVNLATDAYIKGYYLGHERKWEREMKTFVEANRAGILTNKKGGK